MNAWLGTNLDSFFGTRHSPRKKVSKTDESNNVPSKPITAEEYAKFFGGKDLATMLGQGPIKKTPKRSEERLKKQEAKNAEPLTEEMKAQMIELFWPDHDKFTA